LAQPRDVLMAEMILDNVRATAEYAQVLGITDQPLAEQEHQVKQHKDRVKAYLKRHLDPAEFRDE